MKQIKIEDVVSISIITTFDNKQRILLKLKSGWEYYANDDIERIENTYYCHQEFVCWSNT